MSVTYSEVVYTHDATISSSNYGTAVKGFVRALAAATGLTLTENTATANTYQADGVFGGDGNLFVRFYSEQSGGTRFGVYMTLWHQPASGSAVCIVSNTLLSGCRYNNSTAIRATLVNIDDSFFVVQPNLLYLGAAFGALAFGKLTDAADGTEYVVMGITNPATTVALNGTSNSARALSFPAFYHITSSHEQWIFQYSYAAYGTPASSIADVNMLPMDLYCSSSDVHALPAGRQIYCPRLQDAAGGGIPALILQTNAPIAVAGSRFQPIDCNHLVMA